MPANKPFRVSYPRGGCTVVYAANEDEASLEGQRIFNRYTEPDVRPATQADINWVEAMGGRIHGKPERTPTHD